MRGKRGRLAQAGRAHRIIPAHAGQTRRHRVRRKTAADHPRTCGANRCCRSHWASNVGSSPHMRGKPLYLGLQWHAQRIIPAHAGQTQNCATFSDGNTDHPRTCGANLLVRGELQLRHGSSPHMRGKHQADRPRRRILRIIPAHAGQTPMLLPRPMKNPDHPRTCGANHSLLPQETQKNGSSPHMRGKRHEEERRLYRQRIIPAHAGQTAKSGQHKPSTPDHPRTCGANAVWCRCVTNPTGSSPHMRGKQTVIAFLTDAPRIIPAHAGQTSYYAGTAGGAPDHPRTCGANDSMRRTGRRRAGSSPHMRGKQAYARQPDLAVRIIPAHAGQTARRANR